jgi:hypothetical protein
MDDRTTVIPRLEVALAHLKRREESLGGRTRIRSHQMRFSVDFGVKVTR